jgi:hypothetical protein
MTKDTALFTLRVTLSEERVIGLQFTSRKVRDNTLEKLKQRGLQVDMDFPTTIYRSTESALSAVDFWSD